MPPPPHLCLCSPHTPITLFLSETTLKATRGGFALEGSNGVGREHRPDSKRGDDARLSHSPCWTPVSRVTERGAFPAASLCGSTEMTTCRGIHQVPPGPGLDGQSALNEEGEGLCTGGADTFTCKELDSPL